MPLDGTFILEIWNAFPTSNNQVGPTVVADDILQLKLSGISCSVPARPCGGAASDDSHAYHQFDNQEAPSPGKGWIVVRATALTPNAITSALSRGDFYASTGIRLATYEASQKEIVIGIARLSEWSAALPSSTQYITTFVGDHGRVLFKVTGLSPSYRIRGNEGYVRATIVDLVLIGKAAIKPTTIFARRVMAPPNLVIFPSHRLADESLVASWLNTQEG